MEHQVTMMEILHPELFEDFPCDTCGYDVCQCCNYPETKDDYCIMGDKWIPKQN